MMSFRTIPFLIALSFCTMQADLAYAQKSPLSDEGEAPQAVVARIVKDGCSIHRMHEVIVDSSLGGLATWLDEGGRTKDAARLRLIQKSANDRFKEIEEALGVFTTNYVLSTGRGSEWDPEKMIGTALREMGGADAVTRVVSASREAHLAAFKAPAEALWRKRPIKADDWAQDNAAAGLTEIAKHGQLLPMKASIRVPITFFRYMVEGEKYGDKIAMRGSSTPLFVAPEAERAYTEALAKGTETAFANSSIPESRKLAAIITKPFSAEADAPAEMKERAMVYVAKLPTICLVAQLAVLPGYLGEDVVVTNYINGLKRDRKW